MNDGLSCYVDHAFKFTSYRNVENKVLSDHIFPFVSFWLSWRIYLIKFFYYE